MIDRAAIAVAGGAGGDGAVSFRREKFVPRGGPDGGDGGRGGDVVLVADRRVSTLQELREGRPYKANDGGAGGPRQRRGAGAAALEIRVPVGTAVWAGEAAEALADLVADGVRAVVARGGRGGWGNKRFATATRKTPRFAQRGTRGEDRAVRLELKLLADVGLVGLPNAGKSTLLRAWSAAKPRVADYPFTTLEPQLGVVSVGFHTFVAADMPGLIEGASEGAGLGHEFLRHIERTLVLVHVLDMTREDPLADRRLIDAEIESFGHGLTAKPQVLALNKVDQAEARARAATVGQALDATGEPWFAISGLSGEGTAELARRAWQVLQGEREKLVATAPAPVLRPAARRPRIEATRGGDGVAVLSGATAEWLAQTLDVIDEEARYELLERLRRLGARRALQRVGVRAGERIRVGGVELEWEG